MSSNRELTVHQSEASDLDGKTCSDKSLVVTTKSLVFSTSNSSLLDSYTHVHTATCKRIGHWGTCYVNVYKAKSIQQ